MGKLQVGETIVVVLILLLIVIAVAVDLSRPDNAPVARPYVVPAGEGPFAINQPDSIRMVVVEHTSYTEYGPEILLLRDRKTGREFVVVMGRVSGMAEVR